MADKFIGDDDEAKAIIVNGKRIGGKKPKPTDDRGGIVMISIQCPHCKHLLKKEYIACRAFPDGIPYAIASGRVDHSKPFPNAKSPKDSGILFEPTEEWKKITDSDA